MRIAHFDTRKCTSIVEDEVSVGDASRSSDAATLRKSSPSQFTLLGPDRPSCSRSELSKGTETECTGDEDAGGTGTIRCAPRERNIKSTGGPLGVRDANSRGGQAEPRKGSRGDTLSSASKDSDKAATTATLIRNPFSPGERRRLTTNTARYRRWASSSSIVRDTRQDGYGLALRTVISLVVCLVRRRWVVRLDFILLTGTYLRGCRPVQQVGVKFAGWLSHVFQMYIQKLHTLRTGGGAVGMCGDRVDCLPKRWPRTKAKVTIGSRRPVALARKLGDQSIDVMGVLGEGALAVVFSCKVCEDQRDVAVKVERQVRTNSAGKWIIVPTYVVLECRWGFSLKCGRALCACGRDVLIEE